MDALEAARADVEAAAVEASRSRWARMLSRAEIGRRLTEALDKIAELINAARRGLGTTLKANAETDNRRDEAVSSMVYPGIQEG